MGVLQKEKAGATAGLQIRTQTAEACLRFSGPIHSKPRGAGGLRNPVLESRPGPEATIACVAFQLGARLFEFGHLYEGD